MFVNISESILVEEVEIEPKDIYYENGKMIIKGNPYAIRIMGDAQNIVKGFVLDYGDGFPRIITDYFGVEGDFFLDDIVFQRI